jgi:hypothetical protein
MGKKKFYFLIVGQILAIVIIGGLIFIDSATLDSWFNEPTRFIQQDPECDLHVSKCSIKIESDKEFILDISPRSIPLMKPLTFTLEYKGVEFQELKGKIYATNMDMGIHPIALKPTKEGFLEGKIVLPTCLVGNMKWRAEFPLPKTTPEKLRDTIVFTFQTDI